MDSAEEEALKKAVALQAVHLGHHNSILHEVIDMLTQGPATLAALIDELNAALAQPPAAQQAPLAAQQTLPAVPPGPSNSITGLETHIPPPAKF